MLRFFLCPYHGLWTLCMVAIRPFAFFAKDPRPGQRTGRLIPSAPLPRPSIWVQALSVGEVASALPLVKAIKKQYPQFNLLFTVTTRQGMQFALKELSKETDRIAYMPLDYWRAIRRWIRYARPVLFILVETDFWPGLVHALKKNRIPTLLINGRISPRTFRRYWRARFLMRRFLDLFDLILMQTHLDQNRLLKIGVPESKVFNNGNIKFDRPWQIPDAAVVREQKKQCGWPATDKVWVAGSTHADEEAVIFDIFSRLRRRFPGLRLVLAPRRIERIAEIERLIPLQELKTALRTKITPDGAPYDVVLLDTIGELERFYALADIAFVGGSLVPIGGHNLLEPAGFAKPVLFGPHTHNFEIMAENLIAAGGGRRVRSAAELFAAMTELLADPGQAAEMGLQARNYVKQNSGALARTLAHIETLLATPKR